MTLALLLIRHFIETHIVSGTFVLSHQNNCDFIFSKIALEFMFRRKIERGRSSMVFYIILLTKLIAIRKNVIKFFSLEF